MLIVKYNVGLKKLLQQGKRNFNTNKKCQSNVKNAPKELVKHKTHLRKVICNKGDML